MIKKQNIIVILLSLLVLGVISLLLTLKFVFKKDCDCSKEGEYCNLILKSRALGAKFEDVNEPTKFVYKSFMLGGDVVIYPIGFTCAGNPKKCVLVNSVLDICY